MKTKRLMIAALFLVAMASCATGPRSHQCHPCQSVGAAFAPSIASVYSVSGQTIDSGEAWVFTGATWSGAWEVRKPISNGERPHGRAGALAITDSSTVDDAEALWSTPPRELPVSGSVSMGGELSVGTNGKFKARASGEALVGQALASDSGGSVLGVLYHPLKIVLTDLPSGVQNANSLTSSGQAQIDGKQPLAGFYISGALTGTGASQNAAHGLGTTPRICAPILLTIPALATVLLSGQTFFTAGAHGSTNCVFTAMSGLTYYVVAVK